jgi:hypothetical protein
MDFSGLRAEVQDRGFDYLATSRINRYINQVYHDICESERWPFLETDSTGSTAPLTISDLGSVDSVVDATNKNLLYWVDRRTLLDTDRDLTTTGTPTVWYQESQTVIKVYPANTTITLNVHYFQTPDDLSADSDEPLIPARWHDLIIDGVVIKAYKDTDDWDAAINAQQFLDLQMEKMRDTILRNWQNPDFIHQTYNPDSGGYFY